MKIFRFGWIYFIAAFLLLVVCNNVLAQGNKRELEKKRERLQHEINETNKLLKLTEKNKNATQAQLNALRKKYRFAMNSSTQLMLKLNHSAVKLIKPENQ